MNPLLNTSSLSFGHCRIPQQKDLEEIVKRSVLQLGEDEKRMRFVYSKAGLVIDLFKELKIEFEFRSFGAIPLCKGKSGRVILEKLQKCIYSIETKTELTGFTRNNSGFDIYLRKNKIDIKIKSKYLVLATGGYGGTFKYTDNFRYKSYDVFNIVKANGGKIANLECIFTHPFGHNKGKGILIGNETKEGEFVDSEGNFVFDKEIRQLIKNNNYHEIFEILLEKIIACREKGQQVYFVNSNRKIEISPTVHYTAGGIKTDYLGRVIGCEKLFAIGECKADGSRNGGRFPGYPFTSSIVCGKVLSEILANKIQNL